MAWHEQASWHLGKVLHSLPESKGPATCYCLVGAWPASRPLLSDVDIVGPLPISQGNTYLFTIIDRYTRWPEAIPMADATAASCARVLLSHHIAQFGVPADITSDRGPQFTSNLWTALSTLLGAQLHRTTAYHLQVNGIVERFHRQLKAALHARLTGPDWMDELPLVLLGIRAAPKEDLSCAPSELVYSLTIRLPGEFFNLQHPLLSQQRPIYLHIYVPPWRDCDHRRHLITDDMSYMCP